MNEEEIKLTDELIKKAKSKQYSKFEFLRNMSALKVAKTYKDAVTKVARGFDKTSKQLFHDYIEAIRFGKPGEFGLLLSYLELKECVEFYEKEAEIIADIIDEYRAYLFQGHLIETILLGMDRKEEDLKDARIFCVNSFKQ